MLESIYDNKEDIPEGLEKYYVERNGKWELQAKGMKTQADVDRIKEALEAEREISKGLKKKLKGTGDDFDGDKYQDALDKIEDLEAKLETAGKDAASDEEIQKRVDVQVKQALRPVERENAKLKEENEELRAKTKAQGAEINRGKILGDVNTVITNKDLGINPDALPDLEIYAERVMEVGEDGQRRTRDGVGVTPGLTLEELVKEMRANNQRNHWFGKTIGSGSGDGDGSTYNGQNNPFSEKNWNLTEASKLIESNPNLAKSLANQAGGKGLELYNSVVSQA